MRIIFKTLIFLFALFLCECCLAQEVTVSKEFSLRNDFSYELLGNLDGNILLFRDRGYEYEVEMLAADLSYKRRQELRFEKDKVDVLGLVRQDTSFTIYYSYKEKGKKYVRARSYNKEAAIIDSNLVHVEKNKLFKKNFRFSKSEDQSKVLLFGRHEDEMLNLIVVDQDSLRIVYDDLISYDDFNLRSDFKDIIITNEAEVVLLFEKNNRRQSKDEHFVEINFVRPTNEAIQILKLDMSDLLSSDIRLAFDEHNQNILVTGLYHEKNKISSSGYYFLKANIKELKGIHNINIVPYKRNLLSEIYGKKQSKESELQHFKIGEIVFRQDGGFLMAMEMQKELARRSYYDGYNNTRNNMGGGAWKDYYNENIILFSFHNDGTEHWSSVLHKKQFSQDDNNVYSSFFMYKSPSRLRLLYNDEIKKDNTVSEYVIDPVGDFERNSVLSTDYQKLSLRFKDALQISSTEILVPSERSYTLNLVKIKY